MAANFSSLWIAWLALAGGLGLLVAGGELLVSGAVRLAKRWGMSPLVIGLTIVAFGTSMPELFVSMAATLQGHADIMVGNVIGSNIANIGLILGFSALLKPLDIRFDTISREVVLVLAVSAAVWVIALYGHFTRVFGGLFVAGIIAYTVYSYRNAVRCRNAQPPVTGSKKRPTAMGQPVIFGLIGAGLLLMAFGSDLFIDAAVDVARHFGVSELVIGLTLAAVGTSLPELASSLSAIRRRQSDMLAGNILGSNLFNLMMVMGGTALFAPFALAGQVLHRDLPVMLLFTGGLAAVLFLRHGLTRLQGGMFLTTYGIYICFLA